MSNLKINDAVNIYRQAETQYRLHTELKVKLRKRFEELSAIEADQLQIVEAAKIASEELAAKCILSAASMDDLKPLMARQTEAVNNVDATQLVLKSVKKEIEALDAKYDPVYPPMDIAKETLFLRIAEILREELMVTLPLVHEIYAARILSDGRVMPWATFVINVLNYPIPNREETSKIVERFEAMLR